MPVAQVIPELAYPDVDAAALWLTKAFGFSVRLRIGSHRAQLEFGTGAVILRAGAAPGGDAGDSHSVMVRVENVDAGARHPGRVLRPPAADAGDSNSVMVRVSRNRSRMCIPACGVASSPAARMGPES